MKVIRNTIPLILILFLSATLARAQSDLDVFFGIGTARDSSSGVVDPFGTGTDLVTPRLDGVFGKLGADIMLTPHFGVGGQMDWRFSQGNYADLKYRPTFYDFNGIWTPSLGSNKRVVPELEAGIGGVKLSLYYPQSYCDQFVGCSSSNTFIGSANHFQVHLAGGVRFYVTPHVFIRPQVDVHYVKDFFQFGSNWAPEYGAAVGWSFGEH